MLENAWELPCANVSGLGLRCRSMRRSVSRAGPLSMDHRGHSREANLAVEGRGDRGYATQHKSVNGDVSEEHGLHLCVLCWPPREAADTVLGEGCAPAPSVGPPVLALGGKRTQPSTVAA